jgi:hypothetical protein
MAEVDSAEALSSTTRVLEQERCQLLGEGCVSVVMRALVGLIERA